MLQATVIFGSEAIQEWETSDFPPTDEQVAGKGAIDIKKFDSLKEYHAYCEGISDADGWVEALVLDPTGEEKKMYVFCCEVSDFERHAPEEEILAAYKAGKVVKISLDEFEDVMNNQDFPADDFWIRFIEC